ncbi:MAG: hypothetical protein AAB867_02195, partial [Patescibacteria group bacterium]
PKKPRAARVSPSRAHSYSPLVASFGRFCQAVAQDRIGGGESPRQSATYPFVCSDSGLFAHPMFGGLSPSQKTGLYGLPRKCRG